jgi:hypothetical protein
MIEVDISQLPPAVRRELCHGRLMREVLALEQAEREQRLAASAVGEHRSMDGLGRLRMVIGPTAFHFWGQKKGVGYECWNDSTFLREFERDNPHVRVKCGGTKTMVGWRAPGTHTS